MSIHPSLSSAKQDKKVRSVMKRIERLRLMLEKGIWKEGDDVYGLPKIKTLRIKIKKEKAAEKAATTTTEGATPVSTPEAKRQPAPKTQAAAKTQDKK